MIKLSMDDVVTCTRPATAAASRTGRTIFGQAPNFGRTGLAHHITPCQPEVAVRKGLPPVSDPAQAISGGLRYPVFHFLHAFSTLPVAQPTLLVLSSLSDLEISVVRGATPFQIAALPHPEIWRHYWQPRRTCRRCRPPVPLAQAPCPTPSLPNKPILRLKSGTSLRVFLTSGR